MALFKTIDELKAYLPVSLTFQLADVMPFIKQAERDYIQPVISKDLYDALNESYNAENHELTGEEISLLKAVQESLANLAIMLWLPFGQVQFNSGGIHIVSNDTMKTAFQWQINEVEQALYKAGFSAIEHLISFLEVNADDYPEYKDSDERKELFSHFINSAKEFNRHFDIEISRYIFLKLLPSMNRVEEDKIRSVLHDELFDEIKDQILNGTLTDDNKKLLRYIRPIVANFTIAKAIDKLPLEISGAGISIIYTAGSSEKKPADINRNASLKNSCEAEAENLLKQLSDFLHKNADTYPLFKNSDAYTENRSSTFENDSNSGIFFV